jgi:uncharacterized phage protein (TIGR01671 family)|nr:MAG TPA: YopX protein [Caudoviricetes sp.]
MRVILFRGKRTDNGEWAYGVPTKDNHGEMVMVESTFECEEYNCCGANCLYVDENTVGQYTGMKDNNGKPIFEGDILKLGIGKTRFVFYGVSSFRHTIYNGYAKEFDFKDKGYQVIGNIHDNPELLRSDTE